MQVTLIADAGGTGTDWRLIDQNQQIQQIKTAGWNAITDQSGGMVGQLQALWEKEQYPMPAEIYFYGAGCDSEARKTEVKEALSAVFTSATIEVASDILGAARALCNNQQALVAILGTGSNLSYYNGTIIEKQSPALGYLLGDEGSGAWMGKQLIQDFCYGKMPEELANRFQRKFRMDVQQLIHAVYQSEKTNSYLASFTHFIQKFIETPYCTNLVLDSFRAFVSEHLKRFPDYKGPVHVTGSIGFYFSRYLEAVLEEQGLYLGKCIQSPIAALALYHIELGQKKHGA